MDMPVLRARFLLTCGHLVSTCLLKVETGIEAQATTVVAFASFALTLGNLFAGLDVFSPTKNAVYIFCHFLGGIIVSQLILLNLDPAQYLWYVVMLAHLPCILCTLDTIARLFFLQTSRLSY